ncbi:hypothetical protein MTR_7g096630 [Medicago truncatula]|uniref:Uncharacterized protein n=1 Tax=Medicago truncatula TaxID=3880 RepID=A0A072U462_MEDTR|nr:hypothetical protein MTR_7g096630 [Medicago truncatula]
MTVTASFPPLPTEKTVALCVRKIMLTIVLAIRPVNTKGSIWGHCTCMDDCHILSS